MRVCRRCNKLGPAVEKCQQRHRCQIIDKGYITVPPGDVIPEQVEGDSVLTEVTSIGGGLPLPGDAAPPHVIDMSHPVDGGAINDPLPEIMRSIKAQREREMAEPDPGRPKAITSPDGNPKTAIGVTKPSLHAIPPLALLHLGRAMAIGNQKYGLVNWRHDPITASTYYNAMLRHVFSWWDGEEGEWLELNGEKVFVHHLAFAMANCAILLDAQAQGTLTNDRPSIAGMTVEAIKEMTAQPPPPPKATPVTWDMIITTAVALVHKHGKPVVKALLQQHGSVSGKMMPFGDMPSKWPALYADLKRALAAPCQESDEEIDEEIDEESDEGER